MSPSANVKSVDALRQFKAALIQFVDDASDALTIWKLELARAAAWLENDRPAYGEQRVRNAWTRVAEARTAVEAARIRTVSGQRGGSREEIIELEHAKQEVRRAEEMIDTVRNWRLKMHHEFDEHEGRLARLQSYLETDFCRGLATLDRIVSTLEAYASVGTGESQEGSAAVGGSSSAVDPEASDKAAGVDPSQHDLGSTTGELPETNDKEETGS